MERDEAPTSTRTTTLVVEKKRTAPASRFRRVCVFCGSSPGRKPAYQAAAVQLGQQLVERGVDLVYGGGSVGLMGLVSRAVHNGGGHVIGAATSFVSEAKPKLQSIVVVAGRSSRRPAAARVHGWDQRPYSTIKVMERYYGKTKRSLDSVTDEGTSSPSVRRKQSDNGSLFSNQREIDLDELPYDPADRKRVSEYTVNPKKQDEIRRRYLTRGPYRPPPNFNYPYRLIGDDQRRFNPQWFEKYGGWLEYSEKMDKAFCLCCYLFRDYNEGQAGTDAFAIKGWNGWNKKSRLDTHMGKGNINSFHNVAVKRCDALMNQDQSIQVALNKQTDLTKKKNRIRLNASIDSVRYLLRQGLAFRGHDESKDSKNKGNFRELVKTLANQNHDIRKVVLENALENCQWICGDIQKELISYFAEAVLPSELIGETPGELKAVSGMHQRKAEMARRADAFVALPGGYGTLEELLEVITWAQLGIHDKPVGLLNVDGYYDSLLAFIDRAVEEGFIAPAARSIIVAAPTPGELLAGLEDYVPAHHDASAAKLTWESSVDTMICASPKPDMAR